jgi:hypothetical protein
MGFCSPWLVSRGGWSLFPSFRAVRAVFFPVCESVEVVLCFFVS